MPRPILLLALPALAACVATGEPPPDPCGAEAYQGLVGRPLAAVTLPASLDARIIPHDGVVTLDYRPDRLNVRLDERGVIERVDCG